MMTMPSVSRETASAVVDFGLGEDRSEQVDGYAVSFTTLRADMDLHWGYVHKGRIVWRYADHEEISQEGDAFYAPPGHAPRADAGSEFVQFSPTDLLRATEAAMAANMKTMSA
jgi:hypothetical protein